MDGRDLRSSCADPDARSGGCPDASIVGADQAFVEDRRRQRRLLDHQVALVDADVAALVLDRRDADRVLDAAQQDDVARGNAARRAVADLDRGLGVQQVDVELERRAGNLLPYDPS